MAVKINPASLEDVLKLVFTNTSVIGNDYSHSDNWTSSYLPMVDSFEVYKGPMPSNPSVANSLNSLGTGSLPTGSFAAPSQGVSILSVPREFNTPVSLPASPIPSYVRLKNVINVPMDFIDIDAAASAAAKVCVLSQMTALSSSSTYSLEDIRFKIKTQGDFSFNNTIANHILRLLLNISPESSGKRGYLSFGSAMIYENNSQISAMPNKDDATSGGTATTTALRISAYTGAIPNSANDVATGIKVWEYAVDMNVSRSEPCIFDVAGNTVFLNRSLTANATANGTITYIRVQKDGVSSSASGFTNSYPTMVMQVPVGSGAGQAQMSKTIVTSGESITLNEFGMIFNVSNV